MIFTKLSTFHIQLNEPRPRPPPIYISFTGYLYVIASTPYGYLCFGLLPLSVFAPTTISIITLATPDSSFHLTRPYHLNVFSLRLSTVDTDPKRVWHFHLFFFGIYALQYLILLLSTVILVSCGVIGCCYGAMVTQLAVLVVLLVQPYCVCWSLLT